MSIPEKALTPSALATVLAIVLLAMPVSSSASVPVTHFQANGTSASVFSCNNVSGVCATVFVSLGGNPNAPQTFLFYDLFLPSGDQFIGFGTIPNADLTVNDSRTLTLSTDTSTIEGFTNLFCDVNFNCETAAGGVVSGVWKKTNFFSIHSTFSNVDNFKPVLVISNGTGDVFSATAQFSVLGNSFSDIGQIGTQHNTGVTVQVQ